MMTGFLPLLLASALALASGDPSPRGQGAGPVVGPPLRVGSHATLRSGVTSAVGFELGLQVARTPRFGLDLGATVNTLQRADNLLPFRHINSYQLVADGVWAVSPTLHVGPSIGVGVRNFWQEWWRVGGSFLGVAGGRATIGLLTQRTWQMQLTGRVLVDLQRTQLVFDTAEVRTLNPVETQLGLRFVFGRQRSPLVPEEVRP